MCLKVTVLENISFLSLMLNRHEKCISILMLSKGRFDRYCDNNTDNKLILKCAEDRLARGG